MNVHECNGQEFALIMKYDVIEDGCNRHATVKAEHAAEFKRPTTMTLAPTLDDTWKFNAVVDKAVVDRILAPGSQPPFDRSLTMLPTFHSCMFKIQTLGNTNAIDVNAIDKSFWQYCTNLSTINSRMFKVQSAFCHFSAVEASTIDTSLTGFQDILQRTQ